MTEPQHAAKRRYHISFVVEATEDEAPGLAVAVAAAVDCQHVGPITVAPVETYSLEVGHGA